MAMFSNQYNRPLKIAQILLPEWLVIRIWIIKARGTRKFGIFPI